MDNFWVVQIFYPLSIENWINCCAIKKLRKFNSEACLHHRTMRRFYKNWVRKWQLNAKNVFWIILKARLSLSHLVQCLMTLMMRQFMWSLHLKPQEWWSVYGIEWVGGGGGGRRDEISLCTQINLWINHIKYLRGTFGTFSHSIIQRILFLPAARHRHTAFLLPFPVSN